MQDRPTRYEIIEGLQRFLDEEVVPYAEGRRQFLVRVAANQLRSLNRELQTLEEHLLREWRGLDELLGPEPLPETLAAREEAIRRRNAALCERIRAGAADGEPERSRIVAHVQRTVHDKLTVANPGYMRRDG